MFLTGFDEHRHSVTTPTAEVSYVDVGDGPPTLFVHGLATSAYLWRELIGHLGAGRRCIAVDLPLHGQSPARPGQKLSIGAFADVLAEFIAGLGLWEIDLVGHDTGGAVAQILAARCPQRLRTLTLTNCETQDNIPPAAMESTVKLARAGQLAAAAPGILADPATARAFFEPGYQNPEFLTADMVRAFLGPLLGTPESAERFQELIAGLGPAELLASEPALRQLDVPTLIAWGADDQFFDLKWAYWLQGEIGRHTRSPNWPAPGCTSPTRTPPASRRTSSDTGTPPHEPTYPMPSPGEMTWPTPSATRSTDSATVRPAWPPSRVCRLSRTTRTRRSGNSRGWATRPGQHRCAASGRSQPAYSAKRGHAPPQPLSPSQADRVTGALRALRGLANEPGRGYLSSSSGRP